ncbi:hypothetical protein [Nocardiopsis sp. FIRDI 009]|uniref:hypothetical protein n=1 Tax=Nocardiopsis sp. FIRDI 009 TaxID=714197 RepID=UPI0013005819|nr:hypothetical protein [Nocardiopsis sp. FIRDI 009]
MRAKGCAVAIVCVPCRRRHGFFVPSSELVLASLDGDEQRHPAFGLAELLRSDEFVAELRRREANELVVIVDDLAVARSWMLPPQAPSVAELWPALRPNLEALFAGGAIPCRVVLWSELLAEGREAFEAEVTAAARRFQCAVARPGGSRIRAAMGEELRRRRRFERGTGRGHGENLIRERAAMQVANYAVQGRLMADWGVVAYVPWTEDEIRLMSLLEPGFPARVTPTGYGGRPSRSDPLEAFPEGLTDLRTELRLYVADLPGTPGAVRPGLVAPLLDAVAALVTPGTRSGAVRRIKAFNRVLLGGALNRRRTEQLLDTARRTEPRPGWRLEQTVKKLFCHLTSRYTDEECRREHQRHTRTVQELAGRLPEHARTRIALALTGSLPLAPEGMWHPYFSDIDVMPLFPSPPDAAVLEAVRSAYAATARPVWLHLNEGAREGVAGLTHDPVQGLFAADRLHTLNDDEFGKLSRLVAPMRHVGGSPRVFHEFVSAYTEQAAAREGNRDVP